MIGDFILFDELSDNKTEDFKLCQNLNFAEIEINILNILF